MTKGRPSAFDAERSAQISQAYTAGATIAALAKRYACDVTTIRRVLHRAGTHVRSRHERRLTDDQARLLCADYATLSLNQLAAKYGCSAATARAYLMRAGIARRPRGGANYHGKKAV